jgi:hypothetical protein
VDVDFVEEHRPPSSGNSIPETDEVRLEQDQPAAEIDGADLEFEEQSIESTAKEDWDSDQLRVIQANSDARLIVEAGPGTGKTAVACRRLAYLISEEDIEPSNMWMISFTRTAVAEIRARLYSHVGKASFAIRIATVDSHAWSIHSGHDPDARLTGTYEENIARVIDLLKTDEDVADELSQIEHVVIDEAQDLVGQRADLIEALLQRLPPDCGVTVFADEAQAIYGFSDDSTGRHKASSHGRGRSLLERLRQTKGLGFGTLSLQEIYRTSSPGLRKIFSELRKEVLDAQRHRHGLHAQTAQKIRDLADRSGLNWREMKVADFSAEDLILFRTRAEVLAASQFCNLPHRLRLSGYGATLPSWLALCFFDFVEPFLAERAFLDLWSARVEDNKAAPEYGPAEAWRRLLRVAGRGDGSIEMQRLRRRLSQTRPPVELTTSEYGLVGPIVGTIHASKGREASKVILLLSNGAEFDDIADEAEEARVLFVGATRAKTSFLVGEASESRAATLPSGRAYGWTAQRKTKIEIGRDGDISARGLVGRSELGPAEAEKAQGFLARASGVVTTYNLQADPDLGWRYRIVAGPDGPCVGVLTSKLNDDLWEIIRKRNQGNSHKPPRWLNYVRGQGCSTMVLASDDSDLSVLHEPWASSGFLLAPQSYSFPVILLQPEIAAVQEKSGARDIVACRLAEDLIGPRADNEELTARPSDVYLTGILWPQRTAMSGEDDERLGTAGVGSGEEGNGENDAVRTGSIQKPSVAGISFSAHSSGIPQVRVICSFATYRLEEREPEDVWVRAPHYFEEQIDLPPGTTRKIFPEALREVLPDVFLNVRSISAGDTVLATLTLVNAIVPEQDRNEIEAASLFQTKLRVKPCEPTLLVPKPPRRATATHRSQGEDGSTGTVSDEESGALLYRNLSEFAVGHVCSANWEASDKEAGARPSANYVETTWLPSAIVEGVDPNGHPLFAELGGTGQEFDPLSAEALAFADIDTLKKGLQLFCESYARWLSLQRQRLDDADIGPKLKYVAEAHLARCDEALGRMLASVDELNSNPRLRRAFQLANFAMHLQHSWDSSKSRRGALRWRPFQLGFLLLSAPSSVDRGHQHRGIMDLLWFPTGGGKTEAYLALIACVAVYRRLSDDPRDHSGVCSLMRYTLRLLTTQQFARSAAMIVALEAIRTGRVASPEGLPLQGRQPFSIGLWVGGDATPNKRADAFASLRGSSEVASPKQLARCPACGEKLHWSMASAVSPVKAECTNNVHARCSGRCRCLRLTRTSTTTGQPC